LVLNGKVQAQAMISKSGPQAKVLKCVEVSKEANKHCDHCALYQGKAGSERTQATL
jgi:hypothetical protein